MGGRGLIWGGVPEGEGVLFGGGVSGGLGAEEPDGEMLDVRRPLRRQLEELDVVPLRPIHRHWGGGCVNRGAARRPPPTLKMIPPPPSPNRTHRSAAPGGGGGSR